MITEDQLYVGGIYWWVPSGSTGPPVPVRLIKPPIYEMIEIAIIKSDGSENYVLARKDQFLAVATVRVVPTPTTTSSFGGIFVVVVAAAVIYYLLTRR